jgi:hypothetical protein
VDIGRTEIIIKGMLHKILIALGASLLIASVAVSEPPPPTAFDIACEELRLDCSNIPPPLVIYTTDPKLLNGNQNLGVYWRGFDLIYINSGRHVMPWDAVELHEMVHYVLHQLNDVPRCKSEEMARVITARVYNMEVNPAWRGVYRCQVQF